MKRLGFFNELLCQDKMAPVCSAFWMGGRIIHVYLRKDSVIFIYQGNCFSRQVVQLSQLGLSCGIKYKTLWIKMVGIGTKSAFSFPFVRSQFIYHINYQPPFLIWLEIHWCFFSLKINCSWTVTRAIKLILSGKELHWHFWVKPLQKHSFTAEYMFCET